MQHQQNFTASENDQLVCVFVDENGDEHRLLLQEHLNENRPYFVTSAIVEKHTEIRQQMRAPKGSGLIGDVDTLIAATALHRELTVVTLDSDFARVPGLQVHHIERER